MAVYVDCARIPYGRMNMSHMIADSTEELLSMVDSIGVQRKWIQYSGTPKEHFDICDAKRERALALGALPITWREYANKISERRLARAELSTLEEEKE